MHLRLAIENLESIAAAVTLAALAASNSAAVARQSADEVLSKLRELEEEERQEQGGATRPGRVLRLVALCLAFFSLAGFLTYTAVEGFADPLAVPTGSDYVALAVQTPQPTPAQLQAWPTSNLPISISATFDQDDDNYASYEVTAPAKYAGRRYVLMLAGTARIDQPSRLGDEPPLQARSLTCTYQVQGLPQRSTSPCQLISGTFPAEADVYMQDSGDGEVVGGGGGSAPDAVEIAIGGVSHITTGSNWAYQEYSLPSVDGWQPGYETGSYLQQWNGVPLGGWYETGDGTGCREDQLPVNAELTDVYQAATQSESGELIWDQSGADGPAALVTRQRDADEIGNALLALGAATAALAIGFVPVAYDADRERRRALKRQRSRLS